MNAVVLPILPDCERLILEPASKERDRQLGELFAVQAKEYGKLAAEFLFRSEWKYGAPEWFDHRLHLLDPDKWFNDYWTASADNVVRVLPLNGTLLDLCSGDGLYDYFWYRFRAYVTCVEADCDVLDFARKHHSHSRIKYIHADVLSYEPRTSSFDVVLIRGAIEHFSQENQQRLFWKSYDALKPGGYFCGDTPAAYTTGEKMLTKHECEWHDEAEMRQALSAVFTDIETWALKSVDRTTLFWRCRK